jgi:hypothetical protein
VTHARLPSLVATIVRRRGTGRRNGFEFLASVRDGNQVEVREDGTVVVRG